MKNRFLCLLFVVCTVISARANSTDSLALTPTVGTVSIKEMKKAIPVYDAYETDVMLGYVSGYTSNSLSEERRNIKSLEKQFIATYDKTFSKVHNFNAMVGYEIGRASCRERV